MLRFIAAVALLASLRASAAPLSFELTDAGVLKVSDGQPLARALVNMHAVGWAGANNETQAEGTSREGDTVRGAVRLPAQLAGKLGYSVTATKEDSALKAHYSLRFTEATEIQGAYISFMLPAERLQGRQATLWRTGQSRHLPAQGESANLSGHACAFSVEIGEGKSFVIASAATAAVMVQDNRVYGASDYEVRFSVFGNAQVGPALIADRSFHILIANTAEVAAIVDAINPPAVFDPEKPFAILDNQGQVRIGTRDNALLDVFLAIHGVGWSYAAQDQAQVQLSGDDRNRFVTGTLAVPGTERAKMAFQETAQARPDGALGLSYGLTFPEAVRLNGYQVSFNAQLDDYQGAEVRLSTPGGERTLTIPDKHENNTLFAGPVSSIAVAPGKDTGFLLDVDQPSSLLIQDNRGWGGSTVEFRFNFRRGEQGEEVPAGESVQRTFTFRLNTPLQVILNEALATSETDTSDWIAYTLPWDSAPVDVSFLNHKPAGSKGFVTARDGKFVFADTGEEVRFWGTCFSAGANFPSHEQAEKIARRLAQFGINIVRTHHADAPWSERHFFPKDVDNTRTFDAENLDRFDYLIYCLKREGIYIYLDQLVNRRFKTGDEVDAVDKLEACAKPYSNFDPRLIELQKEFSRNLWTHVNPYTGLAYKDDPAIALMEFANENDLFTQQVTLEPYRTRFEAMYRAWAEEQKIELPDGPINFQVKTDEIMRFLVEVQRNYYLEMQQYLRDEVGVRVPMTGSNWTRNAALLAALRDMDYTDSHTYWNHPTSEGAFGNNPMVASRGTVFDGLGFQRVVGKPFFVSEWDEPWPNEWRAELPVWIAAISAFQEWNGLTVYTYRHSSAVPIDRISGAFETFNDPARFGLFAHCALIYRRGDVNPAREKVAIHIPEGLAVSAQSPGPWNAPAYRGLSEINRFDTALFTRPEGYNRVVESSEPSEVPDDVRVSDTGQISRNILQRVGKVDSPRSQAVFGFLREAGPQQTGDMTVDSETKFATIALSSLTDEPIARSSKLLLAAVGRAENTGFRYNMLRKKKVADGSGPIFIDPVRGRISIRTSVDGLTVKAIGADGSVLGQVPAQRADGKLSFTIGPDARTMYYEISR